MVIVVRMWLEFERWNAEIRINDLLAVTFRDVPTLAAAQNMVALDLGKRGLR